MAKPGVVAIVFISIASIYCVILVPERANVTGFSTKYLTYVRMYVTRVSRKSPYFLNLEGETKQMWGNNVTAHLIFFEYLHNEYRRTFVEIHSPFCDLIHKDIFIGNMLKKVGVTCPSPPRDFHLLNMSLPLEAFDYKVPFYKFRVEITMKHTETKEIISQGYMNAVFKDK